MTPAQAVNTLTQRWLAAANTSGSAGTAVTSGSTVLSGFGVWPLLGYLADSANRPGRGELEAALGVPAAESLAAANGILASVASSPAVRTAVGLWTDARLPVKTDWSERLPPGTNEVLSGDPAKDEARLDAWAREQTDGLIDTFPADLNPTPALLLASSLLVRTTWTERFTDARRQLSAGPWAGRPINALSRTTSDLGKLRITDTPNGPLTVLSVEGSGGIDVVLVLGEEGRESEDVLTAGVSALTAEPRLSGRRMDDGTTGPGIVVTRERHRDPGDKLTANTVRFAISAEHDLLQHGDVFGLVSVLDRTRGHFPGISSDDLHVSQARQNAMAEFTSEGFKAAAVTVVGMMRSMALAQPKTYEVKVVTVTFDRPFAFYAVHRESGLILAAGWVAEPEAA